MMLALYTVFFCIALSQCSTIILDDGCMKRCVEELPEARLPKAMVICMEFCKQPKLSHEMSEFSNIETQIMNSFMNILHFLKDVLSRLIMLSKRFPLAERFVPFLQANTLNLNDVYERIFRKKRDAEFNAVFKGKAKLDTDIDYTLDSQGLSANTQAKMGYEGEAKGTGRIQAGALDVKGEWGGDVSGLGQAGLQGHIGGSGNGFKGGWEHVGKAEIAGKASANLHGLNVGGAGGAVQAKYGGEGALEGGIGKGGLLGVEYEAKNEAKVYGVGGAGVGNSLVGIGAGVSGAGEAAAVSDVKGGLGLVLGQNGFGLESKSETHTDLAGELAMKGGLGSYEKYSQHKLWN